MTELIPSFPFFYRLLLSLPYPGRIVKNARSHVMRSGSEASVCDGMCHAERCKARAQASCALASIASTNVFLMSCDEKVAGTCHAERQRSIRGHQVVSVVDVDASLLLSMTWERVFFMAWHKKGMPYLVLPGDMQHGFAADLAIQQLLCDFADLCPGGLDGNVRVQGTVGHHTGEASEVRGPWIARKLGEEDEAVEGCAAGQEEFSGVEGDLAGAGTAKGDAHAPGLEHPQRVGERLTAYGFENMVVRTELCRVGQVFADDNPFRAGLLHHARQLLAPHDPDDARAHLPADLHGKMADTARGPIDQHELPEQGAALLKRAQGG